ncbi:MAG: hypothetical protein R3F43_13435 [bacterium]
MVLLPRPGARRTCRLRRGQPDLRRLPAALRFKNNPNRPAQNQGSGHQGYQDIIRQKEAYIAIMDANLPQAKYGKIVYTLNEGT